MLLTAFQQVTTRVDYKLALLRCFFSSLLCPSGSTNDRFKLPTQLRNSEAAQIVKIHFWIPHPTAGSLQIVSSLEPFFLGLVTDGFDIEVSTDMPTDPVDILIAFKSVPMNYAAKRTVLLVCDQLELFWDVLLQFDEVMVTSSRELCHLARMKHSEVSFIPEFEPPQNIACGRARLLTCDAPRNKVFWHGGHYSFNELEPYLPIIESLIDDGDCDGLVIVSGEQAETTYDLGTIPVWHLPWSYANLSRASSECRLALLPARRKLKHSFLKPASRVRCAFSLGIYALGDGRTPEVRRFASKVGAKVLTGNLQSDAEMIRSCWYNASLMDTVEKAISEIEMNHSQVAIESMWLDWFERTARKLQTEKRELSSCGDSET